VRCYNCGSDQVSVSSHKQMKWRCGQRRGFFSVKKGTVMQSSKIGVRKWIVVMYLMITNLKGVSSRKLARDLDITQKLAWHMSHRLRKAFEEGKLELLGGIAEVDGTYIRMQGAQQTRLEKTKNGPRACRQDSGGNQKLSSEPAKQQYSKFLWSNSKRWRGF